jgi:hypothetical protein
LERSAAWRAEAGVEGGGRDWRRVYSCRVQTPATDCLCSLQTAVVMCCCSPYARVAACSCMYACMCVCVCVHVGWPLNQVGAAPAVSAAGACLSGTPPPCCWPPDGCMSHMAHCQLCWRGAVWGVWRLRQWWWVQQDEGLIRFPCPENPGREKYNKPTPGLCT